MPTGAAQGDESEAGAETKVMNAAESSKRRARPCGRGSESTAAQGRGREINGRSWELRPACNRTRLAWHRVTLDVAGSCGAAPVRMAHRLAGPASGFNESADGLGRKGLRCSVGRRVRCAASRVRDRAAFETLRLMGELIRACAPIIEAARHPWRRTPRCSPTNDRRGSRLGGRGP